MGSPRPAHRRRSTLRDRIASPLFLLRGVATVVVAILIGGLATGGTYARFNSSATTSSATIRSGTATLAAPASMSFAPAALYPGLSTYASFIVSNTGNVPLGLQLSAVTGPTSTSFSQAISLGVGVVASSAQCILGTFVPTLTGTFTGVAPGSIGTTPVAAGGTATVCVSLTLASTAANGQQGTTSAFTFTIRGVQA